MLLYNVTIGIDKNVEQVWLDWTKEHFMPRVLNTGFFIDCKVYKVLHDQDEGTTSYSIQFFARTIEHVLEYLDNAAPGIMEELMIKFKNQHVAFQTLLEEA